MKNDLAGDGSVGKDRIVEDRIGQERLGSNGADRRGVARPGGPSRDNGSVGTERHRKASRAKSVSRHASHGDESQAADRPASDRRATGAALAAPVYRVKPGAHVRARDAAQLAIVMRDLLATGEATAEALLKAAEPEDSPIHGCFEWDNAAAADAYRLHQARKYWGAIEIVITADDSTEKPMRAFHPVFIDGQRQYQDIGTIAQSQSLLAQLLDSAKRDLIAFKHRYATIAEAPELAEVFSAIDRLGGKDAA